MKTAVLYYSLTGNTRLLASAISDETGGKCFEIELKYPYNPKGFGKYLRGGRDVLMKRKPEIVPLEINPEELDLLFIGTPVWAGTYAPAVGSAFDILMMSGRKLGLFCCSMGGKGKTFKAMKEKLEGNETLDCIHFVEPLRGDSDDKVRRVREWARAVLAGADSSS